MDRSPTSLVDPSSSERRQRAVRFALPGGEKLGQRVRRRFAVLLARQERLKLFPGCAHRSARDCLTDRRRDPSSALPESGQVEPRGSDLLRPRTERRKLLTSGSFRCG